MKKIIPTLFTMLVLIFCLFFGACGEVKFEDVPWANSSSTKEEIISNFNSSGEEMVNIGLKMQFQTTNIYNFYNSSITTNKVIRDEIITSLGSARDNNTVVRIQKERYKNDVKIYSIEESYVKTNNSSYCYKDIISYNENGEILSKEKLRNEYNSSLHTIKKFYNQAIREINNDEVDKAYQKSFNNLTYYKLESGVSGINVINSRFEKSQNLFQDPALYKMLYNTNQDYVDNFYYECAVDNSNYATYFKVDYSLFNKREKYLSVTSTTNLKMFGDNVDVNEPEDKDDYTVGSFISNMNKPQFYLAYSNGTSQNYVAKLNENYSCKVSLQNGTVSYYYLEKTELGYIPYLLDIHNKTKARADFNLDLLKFDFSLSLTSKDSNCYHFGNEQAYINITLLNNEISSISTSFQENIVTLNILQYGEGLNSSLDLVLSIDDYVEN